MSVYAAVKLSVGSLIAVNYSLPLFVVFFTQNLHDEPMAILAGNLALACFLFGVGLVFIAFYDLVGIRFRFICSFFQYSGGGFFVAFKVAQHAVAIDQFVAIVFPLRYNELMNRWLKKLVIITWLAWLWNLVSGEIDAWRGAKTFAEASAVDGTKNKSFRGCRWETTYSVGLHFFGEIQMLMFSMATASLFIYTAYIGQKTKNRLMRLHLHVGGTISNKNKHFLDNYRAFKKICFVISLTVLLDIVGPVLRIASNWYPLPTINGFVHQLRLIGLIMEGWVYGLLNKKMKAAYKKVLCCKQTQMMGAIEPYRATGERFGSHQFHVSRDDRQIFLVVPAIVPK